MKNKWFRYLLVTVSVVCVHAFAQDAALKERRELAMKVMQKNQQGLDPKKLMSTMVESIKLGVVSGLKRSNPDLPELYYSKVSEVVAREASPYLDGLIKDSLPLMMQSIADMYAENFTAQELSDLIVIYDNPLLQRGMTITIDRLPKLMAPYMLSIQQSAQPLGPRITQALTREGLLPPPKP